MDFSAISPAITIALGLALCFVPVLVIIKVKKTNRGSHQKVDGDHNTSAAGSIGSSEGEKNINLNGVNVSGGSLTINANRPKEHDDTHKSTSIDFSTNILFIDDTPKSKEELQLIRFLESYGFTNVNLAEDPKIVSSEVANASIIFVDITGVGKASGCNDGTELAVRIKKKYGNKKTVAIYSSTETHNIQVPGLKELDYIFGKTDNSQTYLDFIEQHARRY